MKTPFNTIIIIKVTILKILVNKYYYYHYAVSISWEANLFHKVTLPKWGQSGGPQNKQASTVHPKQHNYSKSLCSPFMAPGPQLGHSWSIWFNFNGLQPYLIWILVLGAKMEIKKKKTLSLFCKNNLFIRFSWIWINLMFVCFVVSIKFSHVARIAPI